MYMDSYTGEKIYSETYLLNILMNKIIHNIGQQRTLCTYIKTKTS